MGKTKKLLPSLLILLLGLTTITLVVLQIDIAQILNPKAASIPADITVDTSQDAGPLKPVWRYLAQGGESADYSFAPVSSQVKALGPEYIRIDHIYDFYDIVSLGEDGTLTYNWTKLDKIIAEIRTTGATPFISLSYMPADLGGGDITGAPDNYGHWQQLVKATIQHISGNSGLAIPNVYYEVWNEPDLFGNWKLYGDKNYLRLYQHAAYGAEQVTSAKPFKLGGPATTALYPNWITNFLDFTRDNNLRVDFYSWHRYTTDITKFSQDAFELNQELQKYPEYFELEKIISEWGIDSDINQAYDNNLAASHLVASLSHMWRQVDKPFTFEIQDGLDQAGQEYWGRWGLLTHQSFGSKQKPRYHAIRLMNQLGANRLELTGQGTHVKAMAARNGSDYQVLLTNYDLRGKNQEQVPITFSPITPGQYTLTQTGFAGQIRSEQIATTSAALRQEIPLLPNQTKLVELTPTTPQP